MYRPCATLRLLCLLLINAAPSALAAPQTPTETDRESQILSSVSATNIGGYIKTLTERPTWPGAPASEAVAVQTLEMFLKWGWDARIESYSVPFPRPAEQVVELLGPKPFRAKIHEPPISGDPYSQMQDEILEPFFIYSPDGDVTAPLVYVNYGVRDDYAELARMGIDVKGKIVIARAGAMWRGGKVELAFEHGAVGMLIYSDPKEDGFYVDTPYPEGSARTPDGVQRGSVLYGLYPGDPTTPFEPSKAGAKRLAAGAPGSSYAKIPAAPLSFSDAQNLLASLGGQMVPDTWKGALPLPYRSGPSLSSVHLKIVHTPKMITIRNVIAKLPGSVWPDEIVVRGNHHDGWVFGAQDPHSGHSAMLEEARILGSLYQQGWRPKRTVVYASWDAEEQGTIGSTEYVEEHAEALKRGAVVYLNTDVTGPGTLQLSGASSFADFVTSLANQIPDPRGKGSALDTLKIKSKADIYGAAGSMGVGFASNQLAWDSQHNRVRMAPPGYGSDHHSFVSHAGVATLGLVFGGDTSFGAYHTAYDNYAWHSRFGDPGFLYGKATAQLNGLAVLRLADAGILPMDFIAVADATDTEVSGVKALYARLQGTANLINRQLDAGSYEVLAIPARPRVAPPRQVVQTIDMTPLEQAAAALRAAAERYASARAAAATQPAPARVGEVNAALMDVERSFLRKGGLPGRPHYANELYSPGRLWDTVPVPAVGDAMLDGNWDDARTQLPLAASTINAIAAAIDRATAALPR